MKKAKRFIMRVIMRILEEKLQKVAEKTFGEKIVIAYVPVDKVKEKVKERNKVKEKDWSCTGATN